MNKYIFLIIILLSFNQAFTQTYNVDFFINKAKENSPVLYRQNNKNQLVSIDLQRITTIYTKPQISANASLLFAPIISTDNNKTTFQPISQGATDYYGYDLGYSDGGQYVASVSINQPLFNNKKILVYQEQADVQQTSNLNNIQLSINELEYSVKYQYLLCLNAKKQLDFSNKNQKIISDEISIMQQLVQSGIYQPSDLSLLEIEQKTYQIQSEKYKLIYNDNIADLLILCGLADTSINEIDDLILQLETQKNDSLFLEKYRLDSINIALSQQVWDLQYKPQLSAFADAGMSSIYLPDYKRFGFSFGVKFSWLLYDGKQRNLIGQRNKILLDNNSFSKNNFSSQNQMRKQKILNTITSLEKQINLLDEQLTDYDNLMEIYKLKISQGQISIINFVEILKKVSDAKQQKISLEMQEQILINTYNYWNE